LRALALFLTVLGLLPVVLYYPFGGVLLWTWISLMNPHRLTWGFFAELPYALIVGGTTILSWLISREPKKVPLDGFSGLLLFFMAWISLTTVFALNTDAAYDMWNRTIKIFLFIVLTYILTNTRQRITALVWVVVISLGYFGVKGGLFAALTAGQYRVWGPPSSFIEDNNQLAFALTITLPLMYYLASQMRQWMWKWGMFGAMALTMGAIIFSYSRGSMLGCGAMLAVLIWRGQRKLTALALVGVAASVMFFFAPEEWFSRMESIGDYEEDASAQGRITIWRAATMIALARPLIGGGFRATYAQWIVDIYAPGVESRAPHSIYFEVLGEHGFLAFGVFLGFAAVAWWQGSRIQKATKNNDELRWANDLARALQMSIMGFLVGGAFLSLAYYDGYFTILLLMAATRRYVASTLALSGQSQIAPERIGRPAPVHGAGLPPPKPTYRSS
jgi:probable O-glycosylation ligase (exosortase A-associated)